MYKRQSEHRLTTKVILIRGLRIYLRRLGVRGHKSRKYFNRIHAQMDFSVVELEYLTMEQPSSLQLIDTTNPTPVPQVIQVPPIFSRRVGGVRGHKH